MIKKLKSAHQVAKNKLSLLRQISPQSEEDINDQRAAARFKHENDLRTIKNAEITYDRNRDRVVLTLLNKNLPTGKLDIEIERNSYEDRDCRKILLQRGIISEEESKSFKNRRVMPRFLSTADMPDPTYFDEFFLGQGEHGEEIVWESPSVPHMLIFGKEGTGKTNLTRNLLIAAFHHAHAKVIEIDLSIDDPAPQSLYRNMSRGCKTTLDDALGYIRVFHSSMKQDYDRQDDAIYQPEFLVIENVDLLLPHPYNRLGNHPDEDRETKEIIQKLLKEIIEFGTVVKGKHLVMTTSSRYLEQYFPIQDQEQMCYVGLGHMGPEQSQHFFGDNGGYFVSPYIKGRGYVRFGNNKGQEFQSYFIEEDFLNSIAHSHQLPIRKRKEKSNAR